MGENSAISWTDHTFNPWIGCTNVSPGCDHCYAEALSKRTGITEWGHGKPRYRTSPQNWNQPLKWNRKAAKEGRRYRVFCASMADVFDAEVPDAWRSDLIDLIDATPNLDWLLLTKRPQPMENHIVGLQLRPNVRVGLTIENADMVPVRMPALYRVKSHGWPTFVSYEPAIGPVNFEPFMPAIDWLICGAESGPGRRPFNEDWARASRDACTAASVPFFYKQKIESGKKIELPELDGRQWAEFPGSDKRTEGKPE